MNSSAIEERKRAIIERVADADSLTPGIKVVHDVQTKAVCYMSPIGLEKLGVTLKEVQEMGDEYNRRYFNQEQSDEYVPQLYAMLEHEPDQAFTVFQQARGISNEWQWFLSVVHVLLKDDDGKPALILTVAHHVDPVSHLTPKVARMIDEHAFIKNHQQLFDGLGEREKMVLSLLAKGFSNTEVAAELHISVATVETHRKNIRRKLQVTNSAELAKYAMAFDLV